MAAAGRTGTPAYATGREKYLIFLEKCLPVASVGHWWTIRVGSGIRYHSTSDILRAGLDDTPAEEGRSGFVLATRDPEHGLSFWNNETGFGRLAEATVFSEAEAAAFDKPIAHDEPEWLACPAGSP